MHLRDKEKTTFMKDDANYFYEVMSFVMALSYSLLRFLWWFAEASMGCRWSKTLLRVVVALEVHEE